MVPPLHRKRGKSEDEIRRINEGIREDHFATEVETEPPSAL